MPPHSHTHKNSNSSQLHTTSTVFLPSKVHTVGWVAGVPSKMKDFLIQALWISLGVAMGTLQSPCHSCLLAGVPNKQQASLVNPTDEPTRHYKSNAERNKNDRYSFDLRCSTWLMCLLVCLFVCVGAMQIVNVCARTLVLKPSAFWVIL